MTLVILGLAFVVLTAVGMPISFAVGVASVIATLLLPGVDNATIVQRMLTAINTFPLLAVIFFVFAGTLMARGGIARRLVNMAEVLVGWLPGSLAQIVCVASMFFGAARVHVRGVAVCHLRARGLYVAAAQLWTSEIEDRGFLSFPCALSLGDCERFRYANEGLGATDWTST